MQRVLILVEGETEATFIRDSLRPHLETYGVWLEIKVVETSHPPGQRAHKGGVTSFGQVKRDADRLLGDTSATAVTTMLDYYGLPSDFPGMSSRPLGDGRRRVEHVEAAIAAAIADRRFRPYLSLHELEAMVFADLRACAWIFDDPRVTACLASEAAGFASPEEINERYETAPSRRIERCCPDYSKTVHGPMALAAIGLPTLRERCVHFASWLAWLESLAATV